MHRRATTPLHRTLFIQYYHIHSVELHVPNEISLQLDQLWTAPKRLCLESYTNRLVVCPAELDLSIYAELVQCSRAISALHTRDAYVLQTRTLLFFCRARSSCTSTFEVLQTIYIPTHPPLHEPEIKLLNAIRVRVQQGDAPHEKTILEALPSSRAERNSQGLPRTIQHTALITCTRLMRHQYRCTGSPIKSYLSKTDPFLYAFVRKNVSSKGFFKHRRQHV